MQARERDERAMLEVKSAEGFLEHGVREPVCRKMVTQHSIKHVPTTRRTGKQQERR